MASFLVNDNLAVKKETKRIIEYIITAVFGNPLKELRKLILKYLFRIHEYYVFFIVGNDPYILLPLI